jgi:hypothetical protein
MGEQIPLFDNPPAWTEHWQGMPGFEQKDLEPDKTILVHFKDEADRLAFSKLVGQKITTETRSIWYPAAEIGRYANKRFKTEDNVTPKYPIYVISKGRWESRRTVKALEKINLDYHVVIEPQEYDNYAAVIDPARILTLPFSNLGQGSIPARNWVWEHSIQRGAERHWILDDNIGGFYRVYDNLKTPVATGATFKAVEDFTDRYENIMISGMNYFMFAARKTIFPPLYLNTRVYSCILIKNDLAHRWRGRYNEDTDLCIRALKDGYCTALFNAFLCDKACTMTMKGGNSDELYKDDGRLKMAESLRDQHPDIVKVVWKWDRWQHHVDYSGFKKNKLILKPGVVIPEGSDDYGMRLHVDTDDQPEEEIEEQES